MGLECGVHNVAEVELPTGNFCFGLQGGELCLQRFLPDFFRGVFGRGRRDLD